MGEWVVGARGKLMLVPGAKSLWGKGPHARGCPATLIGTSPVEDCQEAWGWKQLDSSELAPVTPPQRCWQAVSKIKTRQKTVLGRHREQRGEGAGGWRRPYRPQLLILWLP